MKIAVVQHRSSLGDVDANIETARRVMGLTEARMVVFPEMFLTGYNLGDDVFRKAVDIEGDAVDRLVEICAETGKTAIMGMPRKDEVVRGEVYNSSVAIHPDGELNVYDKWHHPNFGPFDEKRYFRPGRHLCVVRVEEMRLGLIICYDLFFPELLKQYALLGCDGVVCLSAAPTVTLRFFETLLPARAIENTIFMIYSNVLGNERNLVFSGGAQVWGPRGDRKVRGEDFEECIVEWDIDLEEVEKARRMRPTLKDTRADQFFNLPDAADVWW